MTPDDLAVQRLIRLSRRKTAVLLRLGARLGLTTAEVLRMVNNEPNEKAPTG